MKNILLALAIFLYGCAPKQEAPTTPPPPTLPVVEITSGLATTYQEYPASVEGTVNVEIRPQVAGYLEKVFVDEGAYVKAGQPLFKINDQPFREQLNNAKASLSAANASVINTQLEIDKFTPLVANKVISDYQLKSAKAANSVALANVEQAKAMVGTAQINLGYATVKAPVNGFVGRFPKKKGSLVSPTDPEALTQLSDIQEVHVYFALGEDDFINFKKQYSGATLNDKLKKLEPISLLLADQTVYPIQGKIDMIDGQFDKNTGAITMRATFKNAQGLLRSGNTGKVRLSLQHDSAILVPQSATIEMQDKVFVYTVSSDNKVKKIPITIVGKSGKNYLVKDGVKAGDRIVFSGLDILQEGTAITPEKAKPALAQN
ncbi:efflux RND transporter periplasmic adaptor subunit [Dyadobacter subterraneus]|uniref:Efflux RND transporter periplasmic adaptor subunit n=1 Tax=Dyadobacter subterraneus TaxID=2773304 RepID=A0ABR9WD24_9BACT|nr:efflux RND transporter periplasmic adaptor subunit [Dyadobacter subterraneus]MBE9463378.1 efflux RND transporter periplasmic adaptor subunit [Dyadobacter subterraneus]